MTQLFQPRFVLVESSHPGNVGAAARAMKTMGFHHLILVNPGCAIDEQAMARASGALDVLESATIASSLAAAVSDCGRVFAASARGRTLNWPPLDPRGCASAIAESGDTSPAAVVFGPERSGLSNDDLEHCNGLVFIPSNPEYSSLNLAMAVQVIAYELRQALLAEPPPAEPATTHPPATAGEMRLFFGHLERALLGAGFLDAGNPRHLMRRLRRLFNRAGLDQNELNILRGMLSALAPGSGRAADSPPGDAQADE